MTEEYCSRDSILKQLTLPVLVGLVSLVTTLIVSTQPPPAGPIAALFPPWWSERQSILAAAPAGSIIRFGVFPFVLIIEPNLKSSVAQLRMAGAWLILDPTALGGCLVK